MNKQQLLELLELCEDNDEIFICGKYRLNSFNYDGKEIILTCSITVEEGKNIITKPTCGLSEDSPCGYREKKDFICNKSCKCGYQNWQKTISKQVS